MTGPTHEMTGVCAAFGVSRALSLGVLPTGGLMVVAYKTSRGPDELEGGILPHRGPTHRAWMVLIVGVAAAGAVIVGWPWLMEWVWTHMHAALPAVFTAHAPWPVLNFAWILAALIAGGVMVGYGMHLVADTMTRSGLQAGGKRVHLLPKPLRIRTGGASERAFQLLLLLLVMLYVYLAWWPE